jgi:PadR family transcriptional regulator, regulatory protein PadR
VRAWRAGSGPRITLPTAAVLRMMLADPTAAFYGFALAEATRFPSGTIYPILARLEAAGWLVGFWEEADPVTLGRPRRRMYQLTGVGAHAARQALAAAQHLLGVGLTDPSQPQGGPA